MQAECRRQAHRLPLRSRRGIDRPILFRIRWNRCRRLLPLLACSRQNRDATHRCLVLHVAVLLVHVSARRLANFGKIHSPCSHAPINAAKGRPPPRAGRGSLAKQPPRAVRRGLQRLISYVTDDSPLHKLGQNVEPKWLRIKLYMRGGRGEFNKVT